MSQTGISPSNPSSIPMSAAENYQLKWNSHVTNLNSSISSLYKNDKYADVMLFTCNSDEGFCGIPAHKLILGTCSYYFSSIFDNNPLPINTMIYIFLPPDLSRRAVATLIQYMYTGEATVANDILNEVLKGGEILKIRGLCKVHPGTNEPLNQKYTIDAAQNQQPQQQTPASHSNYQQQYKIIENGSSVVNPLKSNKSTPRNSIDKKTTPVHSEGGRTSSSALGHQHHQILTQTESPVVVMTSQPNSTPQNYAQPMTTTINGSQQQSNNLIIVKKDMAIDPGEPGNIPVEHYGLISLKIAAAVKKAQQQGVTAIKKSPTTTTSSSSSSADTRREFYQIDDTLRYDSIGSPHSFKVYTTSSSSAGEQMQLEDTLRYTEKKKRIAQNQKPSSSSAGNVGGVRESSKSNKFATPENGQSFQVASGHDKLQHFPEALSFLTIKEEPIEWAEFDAANGIAQVGDNRTEIITVKPETLEDIENSLNTSASNDKVYTPLTCEVCNLKFQIPGAWVRHIESHSELNQAQQSIPKKRKRAEEEENSENINVLSCDLCENINFVTVADWVHHVQNSHTEAELAMSNNSILLKKTNVKQPKESPIEKTATCACSICKKTFPTYASMLIHKRAHSDEKPFACSQPNCNKGFNIKSNLLRHMRSCHNQIPSGENLDSDSVE